MVSANKEELIAFLKPHQLAVSKAGAHKLVHTVRMVMELHRDFPDFVVVKIDIKNAHNSISRCSILEVLSQEPSLQHLANHAAAVLAPSQAMVMDGEVFGDSAEALSQGDPEASALFCVGFHPDLIHLDEAG